MDNLDSQPRSNLPKQTGDNAELPFDSEPALPQPSIPLLPSARASEESAGDKRLFDFSLAAQETVSEEELPKEVNLSSTTPPSCADSPMSDTPLTRNAVGLTPAEAPAPQADQEGNDGGWESIPELHLPLHPHPVPKNRTLYQRDPYTLRYLLQHPYQYDSSTPRILGKSVQERLTELYSVAFTVPCENKEYLTRALFHCLERFFSRKRVPIGFPAGYVSEELCREVNLIIEARICSPHSFGENPHISLWNTQTNKKNSGSSTPRLLRLYHYLREEKNSHLSIIRSNDFQQLKPIELVQLQRDVFSTILLFLRPIVSRAEEDFKQIQGEIPLKQDGGGAPSRIQ